MKVNGQHFLHFWGLNFIFLSFRNAFVNELHIQEQNFEEVLSVDHSPKFKKW